MDKGFAFAVLSSLLLMGSVVLNKYLIGFVNSRMLAFVFFSVVFLSSASVLVFTKRRSYFSMLRRHWKDGLVVGGFNALAATFFFLSLEFLNASTTAFLVRFSTVFIIIIGVFYLRETLSLIDLAGIFFAIVGAFIINFGGTLSFSAAVFIPIAAALFIALHQTAAKMFIKRDSPFNLVNLRTLFSSFFLFIIAFSTSSIETVSPNLLPFFLASGVIAAVGFLFFYKSLELIQVSKAAVIRSLDPFVVILYSVAFFSITPSLNEVMGGSLIVLGVVVIIMKHRLNRIPLFFRKPGWFG